MIIIGCDYHTRFQTIAMLDTETGEIVERRVEHATGEAQQFYAALAAPARVGIEATGYARGFERLLGGQGHEVWVGGARAAAEDGCAGGAAAARPAGGEPLSEDLGQLAGGAGCVATAAASGQAGRVPGLGAEPLARAGEGARS